MSDPTMTDSVVPIVSGGLDSITMLYHLRASGYRIARVLSFDYGQRHRRELEVTPIICDGLDIPHETIDVRGVFGGGALTGDVDVPDGHYAEESMKQTIVPGRNLIMLAIAAAHAERIRSSMIAVGVHAGDHFIYPDCRSDFIDAANSAIDLSTEGRVFVLAPFIDSTKADIAAGAAELGVPIGATWSCYKGGMVHCGVCGTCVERREAMILAGVDDPTVYEQTPPLPVAP